MGQLCFQLIRYPGRAKCGEDYNRPNGHFPVE
jgi:hypothetical protein